MQGLEKAVAALAAAPMFEKPARAQVALEELLRWARSVESRLGAPPPGGSHEAK